MSSEAPAWWDGASKDLLSKQQENLQLILAPIQQDVKVMKGDVRVLKDGQKTLESRVEALESGKSSFGSTDWKATYIDIS